MKKILLILSFSFSTLIGIAQKNILVFVAHEETYYSEYIVCVEGLKAMGYNVDIRSVTTNMDAGTYMIPANTTIDATANTLSGSSYSDFQTQFVNAFGTNWNTQMNNTPSFISTNGSILEINDLSNYDAFVLPGGIGTIDYRVDGNYSSQGNGAREVSSDTIELVAKKLNELALDALNNDKPILAQCHGASLPVFWRIPGTSGSNQELLDFSMLKNENASGYPSTNTANTYAEMQVNYIQNDRITISSPHSSINSGNNGLHKIITSKDWYPQTVVFATKALVNMLESYPSQQSQSETNSVLIIHGGAVNVNNCGHWNLQNDIPCNHKGVTPADYTDLITLLEGNSTNDIFSFIVTDLDISENGSLPNTEGEIKALLDLYDVVLFYKHWATYVTNDLQNALKSYVDDGGGLVALHHSLYNRTESGNLNKDILVDLYGAESSSSQFGINLTSYTVFSTNHGHFISSYGVDYVPRNPVSWNHNAVEGMNQSYSYLPTFDINDELYTNMTYLDNQTFGYKLGDITPLFSNSLLSEPGTHTTGFVKMYNEDQNDDVGRMAYFQAGERIENYDINSSYGQIIRNSIKWTARRNTPVITNFQSQTAETNIRIFPNPSSDKIFINLNPHQVYTININKADGVLINQSTITNTSKYELPIIEKGVYIISIIHGNQQSIHRVMKIN